MRLQVKNSNDLSCRVISLSGRFIELHDKQNLHALIQKELADGQSRFVVDLSQLKHLNSNGINEIVKTIKLVNNKQAKIIFTCVPEHITELLSIIKLNAVLEIAPSIEVGIQTLKA